MGVDDASEQPQDPRPAGPGLRPAPLTGSLFLGDIARASGQAPAPSRRPDRRRPRRRSGRPWLWRGLVGLLVVAVMAGSILVSRTGPRRVLQELGWRNPPCPGFTQVDLVASADLTATLVAALDPLQRTRLGDTDTCVRVSIVAQDPAQTLAGVTVLPRDRWPHLWIPDSSLWLRRAGSLDVRPIQVLATSPMVLATSSGRAGALGWIRSRPTWAKALEITQGLSLPDPGTDTRTLLAAAAVHESTGAEGPTRVTRMALAGRAGRGSVDEVFDVAVTGSPAAHVVPTTEQAVFARNRGTAASGLVAIVPADGVPVLEYPLVEVNPVERSVPERQAMRLVEQTLANPATALLLRKAGFRDAQGRSDGAPESRRLRLPAEEVLDTVAQTLTAAVSPGHVLVVVDVSASMNDPVGAGTRIGVVRDSTAAAVGSWRDTDQVGLWVAAAKMTRTRDHRPLLGLAPLGRAEGATTHRRLLMQQIAALPSLVRPGGTSLYDATGAAVADVASRHDPLARNVVVLLTDGRNDDTQGIAPAELIRRLRVQSSGPRPVQLIAVGIGQDADLNALTALASTTPGGRAVRASDAAAVRDALVDALAGRG